jgi:photosystem II stability/assembly factor-like uncharacterized protein
MGLSWRNIGAIALGGTVLGISPGHAGEHWLLTDSGAWRSAHDSWQPVLIDAQPLRASTLIDVAGCVIVGNATGGIRYSPNSGQHWYAAWDEDVASPITCFAASPADATHLTLLAGSADAGVLRSSDGGRRWTLVNVGLRDYTILALAVTPSWLEREVVFAATGDGVYRSPNGGRAWKPANRGIEGLLIQSLAISPTFSDDAMLVAGSEDGQLFKSCDQGQTWALIATRADSVPINGICWLSTGGWLVVGLGDGHILRSDDQGRTWATVALEAPLLALTQDGDRLYAGLVDQGLVYSDDAGATWQADSALAVRDLTRLVDMHGSVLAYGATGGIWRADGEDWQRIIDPELQSPIEALVAIGSVLFAAAGAEIAALLDGAQWVTAATLATEQILAMISDPNQAGQLWIATDHGSIWRVGVDGSTWCVPDVLAPGEHPIALALHKHAPVVATIDRSVGRVRIWQMDLESQRWLLWLECPTDWAGAQLLLTDTAPELIAVGSRVWQREGNSWIAHDLDTTPILRLLRVPGSAQIIAVTEQHYFTTSDGVTWNSQNLPVPPGGLLDLAYVGSTPPQLIGLGSGGVLWSVVLEHER